MDSYVSSKRFSSKSYPEGNVIWICERKNILTHQFSSAILKARGFKKILDLSSY